MTSTGAIEQPTSSAKLTPERLMALQNGFWATQILATAAHYRFFTLIAQGRTTADAIASAAGTDARATRMILDSLAALQVLTKTDGRYGLTPDADAFLVEGREVSLAPMLAAMPNIVWQRWGELRAVVKTGAAPATEFDEANAAFFKQLVRPIMFLSLGAADATAERLGIGSTRKGARILDIGAGSGAWSIPFARRDATARITAFDLPPVLEDTRAITREFGVADRYRFVGGNLQVDDFGAAQYDVAILGNICHGLTIDENRNLLARIAKALEPGGHLVIGDMVPNEERTGPPLPVMFAVTMLLSGPGDTYVLSQYRAWLTEAGFSEVSPFDTHRSHSPVVIARK